VEGQALVVAVGTGYAWVRAERPNACGGCASASACAAPVLGALAPTAGARLRIPDPLGLRVGEGVAIGVPAGDLNRAAAVAYLIPPLALVLGAALAGALGIGDLGAGAAGLVGLALGLALTRLLAPRAQPVLIRRTGTPSISVPTHP
jgi:sigma-E factor negative regulatory protein RseC